MMKIKYYLILIILIVAVCGCNRYDDTELRNAVGDLNARLNLEKLEAWCNTANSQISALQGIVAAQESDDYVTGVSPIMAGNRKVGDIVTFSRSGSVSIYNGTGVEPSLIIGVKRDTDGAYYWTSETVDSDPLFITDPQGDYMKVTGESLILAPGNLDGKIYWRVNEGWLLDHAGQRVLAVSSGGDAVFAANGVTVSDDDIEFTLADGTTKFKFQRTRELRIFDNFTEFEVNNEKRELTLELNIKEGDYTALKAELTSSNGMNVDIVKLESARDAPAAWDVALTAPTFKDNKEIDVNAKVTFTFPSGVVDGEFALLKVTVVGNDGKEYSATRLIVYMEAPSGYAVGDLYPDDVNPAGVVFWVDPDDNTKGKVVSLNQARLKWGPERVSTNANDYDNGAVNMATIKALDSDYSDYPAFAWCASKTDGGLTWYLPAINELLEVSRQHEIVNAVLIALNKQSLYSNFYRSSTEYDLISAWTKAFQDSALGDTPVGDFPKRAEEYIFAVSVFQ